MKIPLTRFSKAGILLETLYHHENSGFGVNTLLSAPNWKCGELKGMFSTLIWKIGTSVSLKNRLYLNLAKYSFVYYFNRVLIILTAPTFLLKSICLLITDSSVCGQKHCNSIRHCVENHKNVGISQWYRFELLLHITHVSFSGNLISRNKIALLDRSI